VAGDGCGTHVDTGDRPATACPLAVAAANGEGVVRVARGPVPLGDRTTGLRRRSGVSRRRRIIDPLDSEEVVADSDRRRAHGRLRGRVR